MILNSQNDLNELLANEEGPVHVEVSVAKEPEQSAPIAPALPYSLPLEASTSTAVMAFHAQQEHHHHQPQLLMDGLAQPSGARVGVSFFIIVGGGRAWSYVCAIQDVCSSTCRRSENQTLRTLVFRLFDWFVNAAWRGELLHFLLEAFSSRGVLSSSALYPPAPSVSSLWS